MAKNILEEAVEDVQAVRKAAEEAAKNLLVEAISPKLKEFISSHLGQEGLDDALQIDALDSSGQNGVETMPETYGTHGKEETPKVHPYDDETDSENGPGKNWKKTHKGDTNADEIDDEYDLKGEEPDDMDENNELTNEMCGVEDGDADNDRFDDDGDDVDEAVEVTSEDLKEAFADVLGLRESTSGEAKFGDLDDPNDGEFGLNKKVPGEVHWDNVKPNRKSGMTAGPKKESKNYDEQIAALQKQLAEYAQAFKYLKKSLNEMNLFNAKLIYTTKLMQNNLSDKQKMSVVEAIDRAKDREQVELVYKALSEAHKIAGVLKESKTAATSASRFTKPGSTVLQESANREGNKLADRWAELAGIVR
jgi:hypothetical protein